MPPLKIKLQSQNSSASNKQEVVSDTYSQQQQPFPFDTQIVVRFPTALSARIRAESDHLPPNWLKITKLSMRIFQVEIFNQKHAAILYDLPTYVESYKIWPNNFSCASKSADVSQILIVEDSETIPSITTKSLTSDFHGNLMFHSGLTLPMTNCIQRRFRKETDKEVLASAESAILSIIGGGTLEWQELEIVNTDEDEELEGEYTVWKPDESIMKELFDAGMVDRHGNLLELANEDDEDDLE
jgi:TATA-binding protein-associated factor Taf7